MSASATDHTRLHCGDCGLMVFQCWVDKNPPPETCPLGNVPRKCPEVHAAIINGHSAAEMMERPLSGTVRALMQRLGYSEQDGLEMHRKFQEGSR